MQTATKRPRNPLVELPDEHSSQRRKTTPSFHDEINTVMMTQSVQRFPVVLEPMLRRMVRDEVEKTIVHVFKTLPRSASGKQLEAPQSSGLRLVFKQEPALPIFTASKIEDLEGNPLKLQLIDTSGGKTHPLPPVIKIEIVVIDGDFASDGRDKWTREEFAQSILKERKGRRALLHGEVDVTMRGSTVSLGDITITDNSSWVRSRNFRIGARVAPGSCNGLRIQEAISKRFVVKDHRGESYKKNHPPSLGDEVWRLERIAKDGAFHQRLGFENINTVEDFLKLWVVDPAKLRRILGAGMSDKIWDVTTGHARNCVLGNQIYVYRKTADYAVAVNCVCVVLGSIVDGVIYADRTIPSPQKDIADELAREAYDRWDSLEVFEGISVEEALLRPLIEEDKGYTPAFQDGVILSNYQAAEFEFSLLGGAFPENLDVNCFSGWLPKLDYQAANVQQSIVYNTVPEMASSDDEGSSLSQGILS